MIYDKIVSERNWFMKIEDILEINKIKENILLYAKTPVGQGKIINLKPSNDFKFIQKELNKLNQKMAFLILVKGSLIGTKKIV